MDKLSRFSIIGIIISIVLIVVKETVFSKILASVALGIFVFMLVYHNYKKRNGLYK